MGARDLSPGQNKLIPGVRVRRGEKGELRLENISIKWSGRGGANKRGRYLTVQKGTKARGERVTEEGVTAEGVTRWVDTLRTQRAEEEPLGFGT